jgi:DNA-binding MarR family transcriptional regulator
MSFKELGEKTLITKGTLTGVVDRLEAKGLVMRKVSQEDRRSMIVQLTEKGEAEFQGAFASHIEHCKQPFLNYSDEDFAILEQALCKLKNHLEAAVHKTAI